jgi:hypothetical protein
MPVVLTPEIKQLVQNGLASGNPLLLAAVTVAFVSRFNAGL